MSEANIAKAWKDADYRESLSEEEKAKLPENPAGATEVSDAELDNASGGTDTVVVCGITVITTVATAIVCVSIVGGGTCEQGTSGCCTR